MVPYIPRVTEKESKITPLIFVVLNHNKVRFPFFLKKKPNESNFAASEPLPIKGQNLLRFSKDLRGIDQYLQYYKKTMNRDDKIE